ncbi:MAG: efflux RND transporter periplasmic adaptor subunit [Eubacteriales bacterium]|nr:efflux RND transporter periplasmic adaptor subunit [Eubacteriales bacterium]
MKKIVAIISTVVVLGIGGALGAFFMKRNAPASSELDRFVSVAQVNKQQIVSTVDANGTVIFKNKVSIYAKNSGKVLSIPIKEGSTVSEGDILVSYDKTTLENLERQLSEAKLSLKSAKLSLDALYIPVEETQLTQLETQILQAEKSIQDAQNNIAQLDKNISKARTDLDNAKILYDQGAISLTDLTTFETTLDNYEKQKISAESGLTVSMQQLESSKKQYESTKNKNNEAANQNRIASQKVAVEQAQLRVSQLEKDIAKYSSGITAPSSGTITKVHVTDGENVTEGKLVAEMGNLNDLAIEAYIQEYDMEGVKEGQKVTIKSDSTSEEFEGTITKVYPIAEKRNIGGSEKNVVKVEISMPINSSLKAGYSVKLTITTNIDDNALVIPTLAYMTETNEDPYVFVVKEDGTLEKRRIKIKSFQSSLAAVEGLEEGETIVASPDETLQEGMKVVPGEPTMPTNGGGMNSVLDGLVGEIEYKEKLDTL